MRWILAGSDRPSLDALAAAADRDHGIGLEPVEAALQDIAEVVRGCVSAGATHVAVHGDDRVFSRVIEGVVAAAGAVTSKHLEVIFPDDPFVDPTRPVAVVVALLPSRPGVGFATSIGIPDDAFAALRHLRSDTVWGGLDVGRVTLTDEAGDTVETVLVTGAHAGLHAEPHRRFRRTASPSLTVSIRGRRPKPLRAPLADETWTSEAAFFAVANVQHLPPLGRVAPRAVPHDGLFDVLAGEGRSKDARSWLRAMPRGEHLPDAAITERLAERILVSSPRPFTFVVDEETHRVVEAAVEVVRSPVALKI